MNRDDLIDAIAEAIDGAIPYDLHGYRQRYTDKAVDRVLGVIDQLREQIARDIEAQRAPITVHIDFPDVAWDAARKSSARIARGEQR